MRNFCLKIYRRSWFGATELSWHLLVKNDWIWKQNSPNTFSFYDQMGEKFHRPGLAQAPYSFLVGLKSAGSCWGIWFGNGSFLEKTGLWLLFPSMIMAIESLFGITSFQSGSHNCPAGDVWLYAKLCPNAWRWVRLYSSNETGRHPWGVRNLYTGSLDSKGSHVWLFTIIIY